MVQSSGLLLFRRQNGRVEVFLTHPGGPFWAAKDDWSIPKGELDEGETLLKALEREFIEEVGIDPPLHDLIELGTAPVRTEKINHIWAAESDLDVSQFHCDSMVTMEWPRGSGVMLTFPENDKAAWFDIDTAHAKIFHSQMVFIQRLADHLGITLQEIHQPTNSTLF